MIITALGDACPLAVCAQKCREAREGKINQSVEIQFNENVFNHRASVSIETKKHIQLSQDN